MQIAVQCRSLCSGWRLRQGGGDRVVLSHSLLQCRIYVQSTTVPLLLYCCTVLRSSSTLLYTPCTLILHCNLHYHSAPPLRITILGDSDRRVSTHGSGQQGASHFFCTALQYPMHNSQCKMRLSGRVGEVGRVIWLLAWPVKAFGLDYLWNACPLQSSHWSYSTPNQASRYKTAKFLIFFEGRCVKFKFRMGIVK